MPRLITLNQSNVVDPTRPNVLNYAFPTDSVFNTHDKIALQGLSCYYALYNISAQLGNNLMTYTWQTQVAGVNSTITVPLTIPDGMYDITQINDFLQYSMINNNHYLIDTVTGNFVFYLEVVSNLQYYKFQINAYPIPSVLPAGYVQPVGAPLLPAIPQSPSLQFNTQKLADQLGFAPSPVTYPTNPSFVTTSDLSITIPQITISNNILVRCNICQNDFTTGITDVLYSFTPNSGFATLLDLPVDDMVPVAIKPGHYQSLRIEFVDQFYNPLALLDPNILLTLVIWTSKDGDDTPEVK